jgi:hypothetical protein
VAAALEHVELRPDRAALVTFKSALRLARQLDAGHEAASKLELAQGSLNRD